MTYKIDPFVELISSPVTLVMPNGDEKRFTSGRLASIAVFKQRYVIDNITAVDNVVIINVVEASAPVGEGSFF